VIVAVVVLTVMERKLNRRIVFKRREKETYFQRKVVEVEGWKSQ